MSSADFDRLSPCFEFDDGTQVHRSSSVTWRNNFFIFGSELYPKQISKVIGYKLTLIGQLSFNHEYGSASVMGEGVVLIYFSFSMEHCMKTMKILYFCAFKRKKSITKSVELEVIRLESLKQFYHLNIHIVEPELPHLIVSLHFNFRSLIF